ncbi:cupin domain-containing protein [Rapidithrix thailandica]|uniref:Cupin domain-containing protein n=1 Tax=Rapidithrix thailandica TaxID=413964 RepID=A0AAW9SII3_9BACT
MTIDKINIKSQLDSMKDLWAFKNIGKVNNHSVRLIKMKGEYEMHKHDNGDKMFFVVEGTLFLEFNNHKTLEINEGEFIKVPKGFEHKPYSQDEVSLMVFEPES